MGALSMKLPDWLPLPLTAITEYKNINFLVDYYYSYYTSSLVDSENFFQELPLVNKSLTFSCKDKFIAEGKNCNNNLFSCRNCVYNNRHELFCHIISKRDNNISHKLKPEYQNKRKSRVPGLLKKERLEKVRWIKNIIEKHNNGGAAEITYFDEISADGFEKIYYLWLKRYSFVVIIGENIFDPKQKNIFYIKTAFIIDEKETICTYYRKLDKYKKRSS